MTAALVESQQVGRLTGDAVRPLHQVGLVTPEGVLLEFRMAGAASRILARTVDFIAQGAIAIALIFALVPAAALGDVLALVFALVAYFLLVFGYGPFFETIWSRTPGKMAAGLRVVTTDGRPPRFLATAIRSILGVFEFVIIPFGAVPLVSILVTRRGQRIGDLAAGTIVVRSRDQIKRPAEIWAEPHWSLVVANLDVTALTQRQYTVIREALNRWGDLSAEARGQVAGEIMAGLDRQIGPQRPPEQPPYDYLVCVAAAYRNRFRTLPPPPTASDVSSGQGSSGGSAPPPPRGPAGSGTPPPPRGPAYSSAPPPAVR